MADADHNPLAARFADWRDRYEQFVTDWQDPEKRNRLALPRRVPSEPFDEYARDRFLAVVDSTGAAVLAWCEQHNATPDELANKLGGVSYFCVQLYEALAPIGFDRQPKGGHFWHHRANLLNPESRAKREYFVDDSGLKQAADQYLACPWLHNPYLDWVFADALIATQLGAVYEAHQKIFGGMAYALFAGHPLKTRAYKIITGPVMFAINWILPALICWWLQFSRAALIGAALYYLVSLGWLVFVYAVRILYRMRHGKSVRRRSIDCIIDQGRVYDALSTTTIHVPSFRRAVDKARDDGVNWCPQLLCLVDIIAQNCPITWQVPDVASHNWPPRFDRPLANTATNADSTG